MKMGAHDKSQPELWLKFLKARFGAQGGRALVRNTNPDSRDSHPRVEVFTLLQTDDRFRRVMLTEYKRWRQDRKKEDDGGAKKQPRRMKSDIDVPQGTLDIRDVMKDAGHELYLVGGAVRDHLLGKKPKDFDLATEAQPDEVIRLLSRDGRFKVEEDPKGKQFGIVLVHDNEGIEYEIATFREDVGEGRRPDEVKFTTIDEDVTRRDLTINALFYDLDTNEIVDYVGGIDDLKNGVIKTVGKPADRFREDKLRVMRVLRFAGRLGAEIDAETAKAIKDDPDLHEVSPERIHDEFTRGIATAKDPKHYLKMVEDLGLFDQVFPDLEVGKQYLDTPDSTMQMVSLLRDNKPKDIQRVLHQMKYAKDEVNKLLFLLKMRELSPEEAVELKKIYRKLQNTEGVQMGASDVMEGAKALGKPAADHAKAFVNFAEAPPALTGKELMERGVKNGPEMGLAIARAEREAYEAMLGKS